MLYSFEDCALDADCRELRRGEKLIAVEPQVFDLLLYLIRNRDRVVSKDDLIANVWNGRAVSDSTLTSRITIARQAIGDSGDAQRLIRTIARKGFRFVGRVSERATVPGGAGAPAADMSDGGKPAAVADEPACILIVDDHALIREALRGVLKGLKSRATVIEASNARAALQSIADNPKIELILLDLGLPDRDGFEVLADLRRQYPTVSVVVLSASEDREHMTRALGLGALGFIPKSASREVMLGALNLIFAGGIYVPPEILAARPPKQEA